MLRPEKPASKAVEPPAGNIIRFPDQKKQVRRMRWRERVSHAVPTPKMVLAGGAIWGLLMAISAISGSFLHSRLIVAVPSPLFILFALGGAIAFAPAIFLAELFFGRSGRVIRFVGGTILVFVATHAITAGLFAIEYQVFYSAWHAPFPDRVWFFQLAFTSASAVYQFTVGSLSIFLPSTPIAFLAYGLWFQRRPH